MHNKPLLQDQQLNETQIQTDQQENQPLEQSQPQAQLQPQKPRFFGIDFIRCFACYQVIQLHSGEKYYWTDAETADTAYVREGNGPFWIGIINYQFRASVPLFVMISGYLLLPVKTDIPTFLKTRFTRILFPFIFWCIMFSFYNLAIGNIDWKQSLINIPKIFVNYGCEVGHLWYIYMLIGIYLFAPIISPWIREATIPQYLYYFTFWAITNCFVYIKLIFPEFWGEVFWNNTPMLQNFTGHFGFAVLGAFIKIHLKDRNLYLLGFICLIVGYVMTTVIWEYKFYQQVYYCHDLELSWNFHTINVVLMTFGWFILLRKLVCKNRIISMIFEDVALKSYGMYLIHPMILRYAHLLCDPDSLHPIIFTIVVTILTYVGSYLVIKAISYIPYSKYIIG
ncbi:transmembrane acyltransferase [Tritrichomonas foetus]|uniref:Transmembrane acyltransferase n=1 Tax=Tritrichomonas foetus TaxID=1144522 RepID=A0A1J4JHD8_9EUKA|nr:transmembrane acyltransferase [Tritrichomonas foetus]|eukprot:OHS96893.1 transmembrane acyltransferase [Tritrichomonas foetus]